MSSTSSPAPPRSGLTTPHPPLYRPEAFGFLALFTSITSIIGVIACMHYEMRIMLPKTDEEATNLLRLYLCVAVVSVLAVPALYFGADALLSPPQGARAWFIPRLGFAVCLRRRGVSCAEQLEFARQPFRVAEVARVASLLAITGTQLEVENA